MNSSLKSDRKINFYVVCGLILSFLISPACVLYCYATSPEYEVTSFRDFHQTTINDWIAMYNNALYLPNQHFLKRFEYPLLFPLLIVEMMIIAPIQFIIATWLYFPNVVIHAFYTLF